MAALIQRPDYLQAGQRLLSAPLAARWQRKLLDALARYHEQHRDEPGPAGSACAASRCRWKMKRWCCC
nr:SelB translation factor [Klebsiella pneumoniae]